MEDKDNYNRYLFNIHANGDRFFDSYRPFTFEEWLNNGKPISDGGVRLSDNTIRLITAPFCEEDDDFFIERTVF